MAAAGKGGRTGLGAVDEFRMQRWWKDGDGVARQGQDGGEKGTSNEGEQVRSLGGLS